MSDQSSTKIRAVQFLDQGKVVCLDPAGRRIEVPRQVSVERFLTENLDKKRIDDSTKIFHPKLSATDVRGAKQELRIKPRWYRAIFGK